jgi:hypothetical protein
MADITSEIRRELDVARAKWGETFDFKLLEASWGDTLEDDEMLEAIRRFQLRGRYLDTFLAIIEPAGAKSAPG